MATTSGLDYVIGGIICLVGLFIFYRALKGPMDLMFEKIAQAFRWLASGLGGAKTKTEEIIVYE